MINPVSSPNTMASGQSFAARMAVEDGLSVRKMKATVHCWLRRTDQDRGPDPVAFKSCVTRDGAAGRFRIAALESIGGGASPH
jgi:hypothetical protein